MRNEDKQYLRRLVQSACLLKTPKSDAIKAIAKTHFFKESTVRKYWNVFCEDREAGKKTIQHRKQHRRMLKKH